MERRDNKKITNNDDDEYITKLISIENDENYKEKLGFRFIYNFLGRGYNAIGILIFTLIWIIIFTLVTYFEGTLMISGSDIGWGEDLVWYFALIGIAFLMFFISRLSNIYTQVFSNDIIKLIDWNKITPKEYFSIVKNDLDYIHLKTKSTRISFNILRLGGALSLVFYGIYMQAINLPEVSIWHHITYPFGYFAWLSYTIIIVIYLGPILIWKYLAVFSKTNGIMKVLSDRNCLTISPMSPDNAGGLSILGKITINIAFVSIIPLLAFSIWFFVREINQIFLITLPLLASYAFISFLFPLRRIHILMDQLKGEEMNKLESEINKQYKIITRRIDNKSQVFDKEGSDAMFALEKIKILLDKCDSMRTWPFKATTISSLLSGILIPILIGILPFII